mgnify:CR=1 FL=1
MEKITVKYNYQTIRDKVYACWLGKNIGGTMGTPFEGRRELLDIPGFTSPKGNPLPNDDLDLQLIWLKAVEEVGAHALTGNDLTEYWIKHIVAPWNEYGIGKGNAEAGFLPPLCGEFNNNWKQSNGAWIRSEIWACLTPGFPHIADKYAVMDASVDHGIAEGTVAEIFTAAMESLAFFETDRMTLVEKACSYIPADSRVARSVGMVIDGYKAGTPWKEVRQALVEDSADLGWFQAPANVAYAVLGILYGEGDFKQSLLYAIDCGDDTDCTGATCGAVLGILGGTAGIPQELTEYIGDAIITVALNRTFDWWMRPGVPHTCKELTDRVMDQILPTLLANGVRVEWTDGDSVYDPVAADTVLHGCGKAFLSRKPYSFDTRSNFTDVTVALDREPTVRPGESITVDLTLITKIFRIYYYTLDVILPDGFTADYPRTVYCSQHTRDGQYPVSTATLTLTAGETVSARNEVILRIGVDGSPRPLLIPIVLLG